MTFIEKFLDYTKSYESPGSFWKWAAYFCVGSVLRNNIYFRQGVNLIHPNIYVLLLADSAEHRKGSPPALAHGLLKAVGNTKIIAGRSSIQAILDELSHSETDPKTGSILSGGCAAFIARELAAGIVKDPTAVELLTDLYDSAEEWTSRLRGGGTFKIKNLCFSMFAASNKDLLPEVYDQRALFGGLLGRTFLVQPNEFRPANSLFDMGDTSEFHKELVKSLREISGIRGAVNFTDDAKKEYNDWYKPFRESYRVKTDRTGVSGRIHTSILKLAMILTANETQSVTVEKRHIERAIQETMDLVPNYKQLLMSTGTSTIAEVGALVINDLLVAPNNVLTRKEILRRHWSKFDSELLDKFVVTTAAAGLIEEYIISGVSTLKLTEKCIENLKGKS